MKKILLFLFFPVLLQAQTVVKISNLPAATTIQNSDLFILNQGTTTKKLQYSVLANVIQDSVTRQLADTAAAIRAIIDPGGIADSSWNSIKVGTGDDTAVIKTDGTIHQYYNGSQVLYSGINGSLYSLGTKEYGYISGVGIGCAGITSSTFMDSFKIALQSYVPLNEKFISISSNGIWQKKYEDSYTAWSFVTDSSFSLHKKSPLGAERYSVESTAFGITQTAGTTKFNTDTLGNANFTGYVNSKKVYAVGRADSINYTVGGTQNIFYKINTGALTIKDTSWMFIRGDSIQVKVAGDYEVDVSMAATTSNANDKIRVRLFVSNAVMSPALGRWMINSPGTGNQQTENCPFWYARALPYGAWLSIRIQNQTGNRAINISDFGFDIKLRHK